MFETRIHSHPIYFFYYDKILLFYIRLFSAFFPVR